MRLCATTLAAEMTSAEHQLLLGSLRGLRGRRPHLEIGTAAGGTLCQMLGAFPKAEQPPFVVIDPLGYFPNQFNIIQQNLRDHGHDPDAVDFRVATSAEAFPEAALAREQFDFILIDGCHRIESVMADLKWTRLLAVGGLVAFHDYSPEFQGVKRSADRFMQRHPHYKIVDQADSLLVLRKTAASERPEIDAADEWYARLWSLPHRMARKWRRWRKAA